MLNIDNMEIDFDKMQGLVPAIIQDAETRQVLMLGYMNRQVYVNPESHNPLPILFFGGFTLLGLKPV